MKIRENIPIATLTTMKIGGPARYVIEITSPRDISKAYKFAAEQGLPTWVMGAGANTIGTDKGFPGVILLNKLRGLEIVKEISDQLILRGMGGENWDNFVAFACKRGYSGIEALSGIPGTLGAAPVQNIGAYGQEISQSLVEVLVYDTKKDAIRSLPASQLDFKYRESIFNTGKAVGRYFIVAVTVKLSRSSTIQQPFYSSLQTYIDQHGETDFSPENLRRMVLAIRAAKLPDPSTQPSAGSFFKNVPLSDSEYQLATAKGYKVYTKSDGSKVASSGWLIEAAGLKGQIFHGFRISDKAALVLINENAKTYADLKAARAEIIKTVKAKFGLTLSQEPVEVA